MSIIGIDFGTSNSLAAVIEDGEAKLVNFDGQNSTPTVLFFPEKSLLRQGKSTYEFGIKAIESRYEEDGSGRLVFSFKGLLADPSFDYTTIPSFGNFTAVRFCSFFLKRIKETAELQFGKPYDCVVLGRPVEFSEQAVGRLRDAAIEAGFKKVFFQMEPIAAALSYESGLEPEGKEQIVFVCDIGGGTSDYAVVRLNRKNSLETDRSDDILSIGGLYKAGESFNSEVAKVGLAEKFGKGAIWGEKKFELPVHWIQKLGNWKTLPFLRKENVASLVVHTEESRKKDVQRLADLVSNNWGYRLYYHIDEAKKELSKAQQAEISFRAIDLYKTISRPQFETLISSIVIEMEDEIIATIQRAKLGIEQIDKVILTGGSSLVPLVKNNIAKIFGADKLVPIDTFNSVVAGLALEAQKHTGECS